MEYCNITLNISGRMTGSLISGLRIFGKGFRTQVHEIKIWKRTVVGAPSHYSDLKEIAVVPNEPGELMSAILRILSASRTVMSDNRFLFVHLFFCFAGAVGIAWFFPFTTFSSVFLIFFLPARKLVQLLQNRVLLEFFSHLVAGKNCRPSQLCKDTSYSTRGLFSF